MPSEATLKEAIKQVMGQARTPTVPAALAVAPIPPASPALDKKPASPADAILAFLSVTEYRTYKDLSDKVMGCGFSLAQFSDAYSELTGNGKVVEDGTDKIRRAK